MQMLTDIADLDVAWLTEALATKANPVTTFTIEREGQSTVSQFYHLVVTYADEAAAHPAPHLFLKLVTVEYPAFFGKELTFYQQIVPHLQATHPSFPALTCYAAEYNPATGRAVLLFEDVSPTHAPHAEVAPSPAHYRQLVTGFAMLHATYWEAPRLATLAASTHTAASLANSIEKVQTKLAALRQAPDVDAHALTVFAHVASGWAAHRYQQMLTGATLTLVHRDPHPGNFLYPRSQAGAAVPLIIDWDAWRVDNGTVDLAYMMAFHWSAEQRAAQERALLRHYQQQMQAYGIDDYTGEACLLDYRTSIMRCLLFMLAVWRPTHAPDGRWWRIVRRGIRAYDDFDCAALAVHTP